MHITHLSGSILHAYLHIGALSGGDRVAVLDASGWRLGLLFDDVSSGVLVPLASGEETRVRVSILAPCDSRTGVLDILTLQAASNDGDAVSEVTNQTTVATVQVNIAKLGALDSACDGIADAPFTDTRILAGPGECIVWSIRVENASNEIVCNVKAHDAAPAFTRLVGSPQIIEEPAPGLGSCTITDNRFACTLGNNRDADEDGTEESFCLEGGERSEILFTVSLE